MVLGGGGHLNDRKLDVRHKSLAGSSSRTNSLNRSLQALANTTIERLDFEIVDRKIIACQMTICTGPGQAVVKPLQVLVRSQVYAPQLLRLVTKVPQGT